MQRENFAVIVVIVVVTVNRWIQKQIVSAQASHSQVCAVWHPTADANTARGSTFGLPACPANCEGPTQRQEPVNMVNTFACVLRAGHMSINSVQIVLMPLMIELVQKTVDGGFAADSGMRRLLFFWTLMLIGVIVGTSLLSEKKPNAE